MALTIATQVDEVEMVDQLNVSFSACYSVLPCSRTSSGTADLPPRQPHLYYSWRAGCTRTAEERGYWSLVGYSVRNSLRLRRVAFQVVQSLPAPESCVWISVRRAFVKCCGLVWRVNCPRCLLSCCPCWKRTMERSTRFVTWSQDPHSTPRCASEVVRRPKIAG